MKAKLVALFLLLLIALSTKPLVGVAEAASLKPVLDTSGEKLRVGASYYVVPVRGGSGFALASLGNKTCPLDVVVVEGYHGQPLTFIPVNPQEGNTIFIGSPTAWQFMRIVLRSSTWQHVNHWVNRLIDYVISSEDSQKQSTAIYTNPEGDDVCVSVDLNIKFSGKSGCSQSTVWKIDRFDRSTRKWFVTTGGVVGNPSWRTIENWFKIEKYGNDYKLVYCPTICEYCRVHCRDVTVYEDQNGDKRLALTDEPYKVRFQQT
ncbi:hypothetical protein L6164_006289 [Bauhinia variegata]|uniref:Uncharacterized protein n=1 Tax=Bauhinia variegata TaxID=167791 RepID=A0ACB9PU23_BAUVA|nr:hypothetical protein L6164_006289 [Bauhinia variegata]